MTRIPIEQLSDAARVWVFASSERLDRRAADAIERFLDAWQSHGAPVVAAAERLEDRFIVVAADASMNPSGCSIDKLFRRVAEIEHEIGARLLDSSLVYYRDERGEVKAVPRAEFRAIARPEMTVFDPTIETLGELRQRFARPVAESWHRELLALSS